MECLKGFGWCCLWRHAVKSLARVGARVCLHAFRKVFGILSGPGALFGGSLFRIPRISSSVTSGLTGNGSGYLALRRSDKSASFGSGKKCAASMSAFPLYVVTSLP